MEIGWLLWIKLCQMSCRWVHVYLCPCLRRYFQAGGSPEHVIQLLSENYSAVAQTVNLLAEWLIQMGQWICCPIILYKCVYTWISAHLMTPYCMITSHVSRIQLSVWNLDSLRSHTVRLSTRVNFKDSQTNFRRTPAMWMGLHLL